MATRTKGAPAVPHVTLLGVKYALPFAERFRPMNPDEFGDLVDSIVDNGMELPIIVYTSPTYGESILDGINRARVADRLKLSKDKVPLSHKGKLTDEVASIKCDSYNEHRRHLTTKDLAERRSARVARVAAAKASGQSNRAIAKKEGVSEIQVRRDQAKAKKAGAPGDAPGNGKPATVTGVDGKRYPAAKPVKPDPGATEKGMPTEAARSKESLVAPGDAPGHPQKGFQGPGLDPAYRPGAPGDAPDADGGLLDKPVLSSNPDPGIRTSAPLDKCTLGPVGVKATFGGKHKDRCSFGDHLNPHPEMHVSGDLLPATLTAIRDLKCWVWTEDVKKLLNSLGLTWDEIDHAVRHPTPPRPATKIPTLELPPHTKDVLARNREAADHASYQAAAKAVGSLKLTLVPGFPDFVAAKLQQDLQPNPLRTVGDLTAAAESMAAAAVKELIADLPGVKADHCGRLVAAMRNRGVPPGNAVIAAEAVLDMLHPGRLSAKQKARAKK